MTVAQVRQENGEDLALLKNMLCGKRSIQDIERYCGEIDRDEGGQEGASFT